MNQNTVEKGININIQIPFNQGDTIYLLKEEKKDGGSAFSFEKRVCERIDIHITETAEEGLQQAIKVKLTGLKFLQNVEDCHTSVASVSEAIEAAEINIEPVENTDAVQAATENAPEDSEENTDPVSETAQF